MLISFEKSMFVSAIIEHKRQVCKIAKILSLKMHELQIEVYFP